MQEPVRRADGPAEGVAHNYVADGAADAEKVREAALRVPAASPVLDGWAATWEIRHFEREHARKRVPVVAYTSRELPADQKLLREIGIDAVLPKLGNVQAFRDCVMHWCAQVGAPPLDFVFTVCDNAAGESCPYWPGQPMTAHWGLEDPAAVEGPETEQWLAFRKTFRELEARIKVFASLPIASLDKAKLQARLNEIGKLPANDEVA